jgi:hypothetical protein
MAVERENFDDQPSQVVDNYNHFKAPIFKEIYSNAGGRVALRSIDDLDDKKVSVQPGKISGKSDLRER